MNLTILIPTRNRFENIKKIINYYQYYNYTAKIFIVDSSRKKIFLETKNYIKNNNNINIKHYRFLGRPFECSKFITHKIKTKYVCWSGDDDFYIVSGLKKFIKILNNNKKINAINGFTLTASIKKENLIKRYAIYDNFYSLKKKPIERLTQILNKYRVPFWCVFRTDIFKKVIKYVPSKSNRRLCPTRIIGDEILESFLFAFFTKIYHFNYPLFLRTVPAKKYAKHSIDKLYNAKKFSIDNKKSFNYIERTISNLLNKDEDKKIFKYELNQYIKNNIKIMPKFPILIRGIHMHFRRLYARFYDKNFKIFLNLINWLENN